jgi:hypothetical protein
MKNLLQVGLAGLCFLFAFTANSQDGRHFDDKPYVEGEFLIQYKDGTSIRELVNRAPENWKVELLEFISPPMRVWHLEFDHTQVGHGEFQNWCYEQSDIVSLADYNYYIEMRSTIPNDANFTQQWHHNNTGQTGGTVDADIDSDLAWDITTGGMTANNHDIVVAVIESGNLDHIDLDPNRWMNTAEIDGNGIDDDGNGYIDDVNGWNPVQNNDNYGTGGHGTSCLGMIGAKGDNGSLVVGANWDVKLMVVGDYSISTQANAVEAYTYPLTMRKIWNQTGGAQGAFVVATSSSWGIDGANPNNYPIWCAFYDTLGTHGVLNVGATTNQNLNVDTAGDMPTACNSPYMIGVGRTNHNDGTAGGYGQTTIELGAPGINVVTTANTNTTTTTTGTSFACPLTAGVIGLAYSIPCPSFMSIVMNDPQQGADLVLQALLDGTDPKPQLASKFVTGGRLNSRNTLDELMTATCTGTACLSPSSVSTTNINDTDADVQFTAYGTGNETVLFWQEAGSGSWTVVGNVTSPYDLSGLTACTDYEYYLATVCGPDTSSVTQTLSFSTTGCGTCVDASYCASEATDNVDEWVDIFTIDSYTNNSGNDNGYGDFTGASVITLQKTNTYAVSITPDWGGPQYNAYSRVWIDLDHSGSFEAGELLYDQGTANQNVATGNITIPASATVGSTRLRVQLAYQGNGQPNLPAVCGTFTWGEVEDYCVEIADAGPACGYSVTTSSTEPTCNGGNDGELDISHVSGGTAPYTYSWSPGGSTSATLSNISAGSYSVIITDNASCDTTINFTLGEPSAVSATTASDDVSCDGDTDGSITLTGTGGTPGYEYSIDNGSNYQTSQTFTNLTPGAYPVMVRDANNCTFSTSLTVGEPNALSYTSNVTNVVSGGDGAIDITVSGGNSPYNYTWSGPNSYASASEDPSSLEAGTYTCTVTDANGCVMTTSSIEVYESTAGIGSNEIQFTVYPNPTNDILNISFVGIDQITMNIIDNTGRYIMTRMLNNENNMIEVGHLASGVYNLQLSNTEGFVTNTQIIIQ